MTRESQKEAEERILDAYFKANKIAYDIIEEREHPDFIVQTLGERIGVEIIEYHLPQKVRGGFTRRQVEGEWERIRSFVAEFRKAYAFLNGLSVYLEFKGMRTPSSRQTKEFVLAVTDEIKTSLDQLPDGYHYIDIKDDSPSILQQYLKSVRIRYVDCYMEWDWNYDVGSIGTSDEEMVVVLRSKLSDYYPPEGLESNLLIVAGWGGRMSEIIAPLSAEQFNNFKVLNEALLRSRFNIVAVLCFIYLIWERGKGWRELSKE